MEFNTKEKCNEFVTDPGDRYAIEYDTIVEPNGRVTIKPIGKKDVFQEIQSWRDQTDIHFVLNQMALGRMKPRQGMYGDFTEAPENMVEAMQMMINAEKSFYGLPLDVRKKFDNDYKQWMVMASNDPLNYTKLMGFKTAAVEDPAGSHDSSVKKEGES